MEHGAAESWDRQAFIGAYRPRSVEPEVWAAVGEAVTAWVSAASSDGRSRTTQLLVAASRLAAWAHEESVPLRADTVLRDTTIERFCAVAERSGSFSATTGHDSKPAAVPRAGERCPRCGSAAS